MRRRGQTGFVMAEALVALAIAAMTLALLTSASWGLRITAERRAAAAQTDASDWLAARRALGDWVTGVSATLREDVGGRFTGTPTMARMVVEPAGNGQTLPFVAELRVTMLDEQTFALIAARYFDIGDARASGDDPQETEILRAREPMRLLYLMPRMDGPAGENWRYESGGGDDGLPAAVAVEVADRRVLTARIFATLSASCLSALGPSGIEDDRCALR